MIEYYKQFKENGLKKLEQYFTNSWIKVINPNDKEIKSLIERFDLDKDLLIDGLDLYEIPRVEEENKNVYIFLRVPVSRVENESTSSFLTIITKNDIITVSMYDLSIFERFSTSRYFFTNRKSRCFLQILFYVFRAFNLNVREILKTVKRGKRNILNLKEKNILDLVSQEDTLNDYVSSFSPLIDMHKKILKTKSLKFRKDEKEFIEDLVVDLNQTFNTCRVALKTISNMRDYYSTTLTNNLNKIITVLTIFTIFLTIPTVISSVYGMNIALPLQKMPNIFLLLTGITILIWIIVFVAFKKGKII